MEENPSSCDLYTRDTSPKGSGGWRQEHFKIKDRHQGLARESHYPPPLDKTKPVTGKGQRRGARASGTGGGQALGSLSPHSRAASTLSCDVGEARGHKDNSLHVNFTYLFILFGGLTD